MQLDDRTKVAGEGGREASKIGSQLHPGTHPTARHCPVPHAPAPTRTHLMPRPLHLPLLTPMTPAAGQFPLALKPQED